jgi:hypothetical protein
VDGGSIQPEALEIHLSKRVVRRIDTYVEDFSDGAPISLSYLLDAVKLGIPVRSNLMEILAIN